MFIFSVVIKKNYTLLSSALSLSWILEVEEGGEGEELDGPEVRGEVDAADTDRAPVDRGGSEENPLEEER